jgi:hypothetical protein
MPSGNDTSRRAFDTGASQAAQDHFNAVAGHLESLITQRDRDVSLAMAEYQADGVSDEYAGKEQRWHNVAGQVRLIIQTLRGSLGSNDETAATALQRAGTAVANIG